MNRNPSRFRAAVERAKSFAGHGAAVAGGVLVTATPALAFDATTITAAITDHTATAVLIVGTMILGFWTLRAMGLLGRK